MAQFTVTWRGDGDYFIVTTVEIAENLDPRSLSTNEWADRAWKAENLAAEMPEDQWGPSPSETGYDLISVVRGVPEFIY